MADVPAELMIRNLHTSYVNQISVLTEQVAMERTMCEMLRAENEEMRKHIEKLEGDAEKTP